MKVSILNCLAFIIAILSVLIFLLLSIEEKSTLPAKRGENWIVLFAHPDDETMFFAPALFSLSSIGVNLHLISITSGNSEGLGPIRIQELFSAAQTYGIPKGHVHFLDPEEHHFPDGFLEWDISNLSSALLPELNRFRPHGIITFDWMGISHHPNHENCFHALKAVGRNLTASHLLALESVPLWRKYSAFFDLFYVMFIQESGRYHAVWNNPIRVYHAMTRHRSQLVWFRYLYMAFSRYVYVNTFVGIT